MYFASVRLDHPPRQLSLIKVLNASATTFFTPLFSASNVIRVLKFLGRQERQKDLII
jgi:hypothetical protein